MFTQVFGQLQIPGDLNDTNFHSKFSLSLQFSKLSYDFILLFCRGLSIKYSAMHFYRISMSPIIFDGVMEYLYFISKTVATI